MTNPKQIPFEEKQYCLQELPADAKFPSYNTVLGTPVITDVPDTDFFVGEPLEIKDQDQNYISDYCAAYAAASVSEDQEGVLLVPEWTFAQAKKLLVEKLIVPDENKIKQIIAAYGLNLVDICEAGIKAGFLEREYDPFKCDTPERPERSYLADWRNWPEDLGALAWEHAKNSYFAVDGPYDMFDNMRSVMWKNLPEKRSIVTGVKWRGSWSALKDGMIPEDTDPNERGSGHAIKIFGQKKCKDGSIRLVAQLSDNTFIGDKGLYYFPRSVVNREFTYGAFTFQDMNQEKAMFNTDLNIKFNASTMERIWKTLIYIIQQLFNFKK